MRSARPVATATGLGVAVYTVQYLELQYTVPRVIMYNTQSYSVQYLNLKCIVTGVTMKSTWRWSEYCTVPGVVFRVMYLKVVEYSVHCTL